MEWDYSSCSETAQGGDHEQGGVHKRSYCHEEPTTF